MGYLAAYAVREMNSYTLIRLNGPYLKRGQFPYLYLIRCLNFNQITPLTLSLLNASIWIH